MSRCVCRAASVEPAEGQGPFPRQARSVLLPPCTSIAVAGFFVVALIAGLSARSLERAPEDLRTTNRELDRRVQEGTEALRIALVVRVQERGNTLPALRVTWRASPQSRRPPHPLSAGSAS